MYFIFLTLPFFLTGSVSDCHYFDLVLWLKTSSHLKEKCQLCPVGLLPCVCLPAIICSAQVLGQNLQVSGPFDGGWLRETHVLESIHSLRGHRYTACSGEAVITSKQGCSCCLPQAVKVLGSPGPPHFLTTRDIPLPEGCHRQRLY